MACGFVVSLNRLPLRVTSHHVNTTALRRVGLAGKAARAQPEVNKRFISCLMVVVFFMSLDKDVS